MITEAEAKDLIDDIFEEEALVIGGLAAVHDLTDDLVWRLVRNLDVIRTRALQSLGEDEAEDHDESRPARPNLKPHPAIEDFLLKIRSE